MSPSRASSDRYMLVGLPSVRLVSTPARPSALRARCATTCARVQSGSPLGAREGRVVEAVDRADQPLGGVREQLEGALGAEVVHGSHPAPAVAIGGTVGAPT